MKIEAKNPRLELKIPKGWRWRRVGEWKTKLDRWASFNTETRQGNWVLIYPGFTIKKVTEPYTFICRIRKP